MSSLKKKRRNKSIKTGKNKAQRERAYMLVRIADMNALAMEDRTRRPPLQDPARTN